MIGEALFHSAFFTEHVMGKRPQGLGHKIREYIDSVVTAKLPSEKATTLPVLEVNSLTRTDLIAHCKTNNVPLVIRGGAKDWGCVQKWSFEFFAERYGDVNLFCPILGELSLRSLCQRLINGETAPSMKFHPLLDFESQLRDDARWDWMKQMEIGPSAGHVSNLFMSAGNTATMFHAANVSNFFVQVTGQKTWWLYPPSVTKWIKPNAAAFHFTSPMVPPEFDPNSRLGYMEHYKVVLNPGDILYNPPFFWHYVATNEASIALAYKWINLVHCFRSSKFLTVAPFFSRHSTLLSLFAKLMSLEKRRKTVRVFYKDTNSKYIEP